MKKLFTAIIFLAIYMYGGIGIGESGVKPLPVELSAFSSVVEIKAVSFKWTTATEKNNFGFQIERSIVHPSTNINSEFIVLGFVHGSGNSNSPKTYTFRDESVPYGKYIYRLKQFDTDGKYTIIKQVEIETGVPNRYELQQNYPNPFNPVTTISYSLPEESNVTIKIFNTLGNEVGTIVNERQNTGSYNVSYNAMSLSSGVYFYRIEAYSLKDSRVFIETKKMSVIK